MTQARTERKHALASPLRESARIRAAHRAGRLRSQSASLSLLGQKARTPRTAPVSLIPRYYLISLKSKSPKRRARFCRIIQRERMAGNAAGLRGFDYGGNGYGADCPSDAPRRVRGDADGAGGARGAELRGHCRRPAASAALPGGGGRRRDALLAGAEQPGLGRAVEHALDLSDGQHPEAARREDGAVLASRVRHVRRQKRAWALVQDADRNVPPPRHGGHGDDSGSARQRPGDDILARQLRELRRPHQRKLGARAA